MITDKKSVDSAKAFAKAYKPSEDDHPDLQSRVVLFDRAVAGKNDREIQAHARTLVRFLQHLDIEIPKPAKKAASSGQRGGSGTSS
jgi:hypothetical protein